MHSFKKQYFRLDIIVGKVNLFKFKTYMSDEDTEALKLRKLFKEYETRVSLAMIPLYEQRLQHIDMELQEKRVN